MIDDRPGFEEEHRMYREAARRFFADRLVPHMEEWDEAGVVPKSFWKEAAEQGFVCPQVPEAYGGPGGDFRFNAIVNEELCYTGQASVGIPGHNDLCCNYILNFGTEEQKQRWLPDMVSAERIAAVAMSEPGTGSDLKAVRTRAVKDGDSYIVSGQKTFITNGQNADLIITVVKTDPAQGARGISLLMIESGMEGFQRGRNLKKIGMKGQDTSELYFEDVRVPAENLIGKENDGFAMLMHELPQERLSIAIGACAYAQKAFELANEYTKERKAFDQPIAAFQNTRFKLAEMKTKIAVGWSYVDQCLAKHVEGRLSVTEAAMAKLYVAEMLSEVVDDAVQLHGGYGFMSEYLIARMYCDSRVQRIYGGTSEIMKEIISRSL